MRSVLLALVIAILGPSVALADGTIGVPTDPTGSEGFKTTQDPGWWQRTFVGWDANGDGKYSGAERGILIMAWDAVCSVFTGIGNFMMDIVWNAIPQDWRVDASSLFVYVRIANCWVPLDFMLSLFFAYYSFVATFVTFRFVLKFIPFIGG